MFCLVIQLNILLGKKIRWFEGSTDYWDVATYFELHAVQQEWKKACQAALQMYLLNPSSWRFKTTLNNLKIVHDARLTLNKQKSSKKLSNETTSEDDIYNFWIDFFNDAINSDLKSLENKELPAQLPILIRDNYEQVDGTGFMNMYVKGCLQLNFHTGTDPQTLVIRLLEQHKHIHDHDRVKTIEMNLIKSIVFKRKMSKYRRETSHMEIEKKFNFKFECNEHGRIELGREAYGIVYLAKDLYTMKKFAIKEVRIGKADDINAIQTKIKNISTLNLVKYEGTAIIRDRKPAVFQIIMEYVEGGSLSQLIRKKFVQLNELWIKNYTKQILEGIQYLHENHIIHRDIKPDNTLVNSNGEVKITDFGTSIHLVGLRRGSNTIGTPQYISPDMVNISPTGYGSEVDIWSIRCTVLEMVTGEKPYHEITNPFAILYKIGIEKQPPHIAETLSENIKSFLNK
ncbi:unnamed protein product [Rotaria sordida]|uniref:Protein kinase domain-containing protein n=1 Tax=Rotaria sordida TaxID=392033 RepID=A0A819G8I5_9BILA|nr:unnamed protein product [Rotaria sordida]